MYRRIRFVAVLVFGLSAAALAACGGGGGSVTPPSATPTPAKPTPTPTPSVPTASKAIAAAQGGTLQLAATGGAQYVFTVPANALSADATVTVTEVPQSRLPAPLAIVRHAHSPFLTPGAGNTFVYSFTIDLGGANLRSAISLAAQAATTQPAGTVFNLAMLQSSQWVDVGTAVVTGSGAFATNLSSQAYQGIISGGTYLIYVPAPGTSTTVANFGLALISDDGYGNPPGQLDVVHLEDSSGNAIPAPTVTAIPYANAFDLDGAAMTPDGSHGIMVDGGNTLRFFSGVQTGSPVATAATLDVSSYGGDGDSVAIMPNGDEAVVSADSQNQLVLVSGIISGSPVVASTIATPDYRDGVVISNDGKVLLARGSSGLTVYAIAAISPTPGPIGGTIAHSFSKVADLTSVPIPNEDGRDGMAISPVDSSRGVAVGIDTSGNPVIAALTGLTGSAPAVQISAIRVPAMSGRFIPRGHSEQNAGRHRAASITGARYVQSVAISTDGKMAFVGTDAGIAVFTGVDTGTLTQIQFYAPPDGTGTLGSINTLGVTLDGKYLVALGHDLATSSNTALLTMPISSTGLGAPIGVLSGVPVPDNDQLLIH